MISHHEPFRKTVLPRRCWGDGFIAYAHSANSAHGDIAIDTILIPDEVAWCLIPGKRLDQLACNPFGRRICRNVDPDELPPIQSDDDESIEQVEANGRDNEQIHGSNVWRVITHKSAPSLTRRSRSLGHVFGYRRLSDLKAELKQLAMNTRCSPQWVFDADPPDQSA